MPKSKVHLIIDNVTPCVVWDISPYKHLVEASRNGNVAEIQKRSKEIADLCVAVYKKLPKRNRTFGRPGKWAVPVKED